MINNILYTFPNNSIYANKFYETLSLIICKLPNHITQKDQIVLRASNPSDSLPTTSFISANVPFPQIHFDHNKDLILKVGNLTINDSVSDKFQYDNREKYGKVLERKDSLGKFVELTIGRDTQFRLPIEELYMRIKDHIVRIDHTGINIPSLFVSKLKWDLFIKKLAAMTNLYKYPTGEKWPFILPSTKKEFKSDINKFPAGREPKFELVYDTYSPVPAIQIDMETDLTRHEVEQLLPSPYGISFPNLADFFRTVYTYHEWVGLDIRFDIRFKNSNSESDWETGKWLVQEGGRIVSN